MAGPPTGWSGAGPPAGSVDHGLQAGLTDRVLLHASGPIAGDGSVLLDATTRMERLPSGRRTVRHGPLTATGPGVR